MCVPVPGTGTRSPWPEWRERAVYDVRRPCASGSKALSCRLALCQGTENGVFFDDNVILP